MKPTNALLLLRKKGTDYFGKQAGFGEGGKGKN